jgi:hypothetical protein
MMTPWQWLCLILAMLFTLLTPVIGSARWFPKGKFGMFLIAMGGASIGIFLWMAQLPPIWFSGGKSGFAIAGTLMISGFGFRTADEKFYRLPYLFSFGAVLLVANIWASIRAHI